MLDDQADGESQHSGAAADDYFVTRDGERFAGLHLIIDLIGAENLSDLTVIDAALRRCVAVSGATLLHLHLHKFGEGGGISGVAVLAESHISIHSWPERAYAAIDIFMCGETTPEAAIDVLRDAFAPQRVDIRELRRGRETDITATDTVHLQSGSR